MEYDTIGLNFGQAVEAARGGARICRTGWNGKNMWLEYVAENMWQVRSSIAADAPRGLKPFLGMKTADGYFVPWLASQTDVLETDWAVVRR